MKTIVEYEDYRDFILDKLQERKKKSKVFSFQLISSKLGTTKSYLKPVALDQFVECSFFGFVALVVIGFGIGNRHRQAACLQRP